MKNQKSILITGASTGIGKSCAVHLAGIGFKIFAGVRKEQDAKDWQKKGYENIQPVILDVTDIKQVEATSEILTNEKEYPLYGLINNAGIGISGVVEVTPADDFLNLLKVNVLGMHAVTKSVLPLLRKSQGRIINIGSTASFFAGPGSSAYTASKFAVRGYTDCLRVEVTSFGMHVSLIAPGAIETEIWNKSAEYKKSLRKNTSAEIQEAYRMFISASDKMIKKIKPIPAIHVAKATEHALTAKKPKYTYIIGHDAKKAYNFTKLPKRIVTKLLLKHIEKSSIKS